MTLEIRHQQPIAIYWATPEMETPNGMGCIQFIQVEGGPSDGEAGLMIRYVSEMPEFVPIPRPSLVDLAIAINRVLGVDLDPQVFRGNTGLIVARSMSEVDRLANGDL